MPEIWSSVLTDIRSQVRDDAYNAWFRPIGCSTADPDRVILSVPDDFYLSWFQDNYSGLLNEVLGRHLGSTPEVEYRLQKEARTRMSEPKGFSVGVDPKYTFESFVVGDSNRFATAAAKGVAHKPGESYNPLFVYGKVGLGKTHLLHALGNEAIRLDSKTRVRYVTCETFVNDVVQMLTGGRGADAFRALYRDSCDILLVDDVQFLGGKEKSQIEFFNVFNTLYGMRKQIVLSCDRYPRDIPQLEQRLQSRFQWGLVVDIEQPDLETRVAILHRKAAEYGMMIPTDVAMLVATHIKSNVRELEGSLTRIRAYLDLAGGELTTETARLALGNLLSEGGDRITVERIMQTVANYYNVTTKDLRSAVRKRVIATPRHIAMYLAKSLTDCSYPTLGERFGGRDHTTVLSAVQKVERLVRVEDSEVARAVARLKEMLQD